ncbi:hypothetical protein PHLCEN_2v6335 [Hermanssonia centrifuga]|uniref:Uncharacterized protein n=1 Tax=Hermanssonia centrifuga TaxID=98765 RepID=A0A2R6NZS6_9APHY|nr:hypothetical protein PHLCEN_2v6335 [Hermanssonia centrifuga]
MSVFAKSMALIEKQRETTDTDSDVRTPLTVRLPAPPTHMLTIQITLRMLPIINRLVASKPPRPRMRIEFRRVYTLMLYLGRKPAGQVLAMRDAPVELGPDLVEGRKQAYDAFVGFASSIPQMFLYWKHPGGPSHVWQVDGPDKTGINEV